MKILAFESSAKGASVALCQDGVLVAQSLQNSGLTHSRTLLPMAEDLLKNCACPMENIDLLAVAAGPGSFTGVRIGVATVKGLSWALEKPCVGVSTLAAMAWHGLAVSEHLICAVMDARRGQVYNALFEISDSRPQRLCQDRAISLDQLIEELEQQKRPVFFVGDGAQLGYDRLIGRKTVPALLAPENLRIQSAWGVAMAAANETPGNADALLPVYLRLSQAERERQARLTIGQNG